MADVSKIKLGSTTYNIKDAGAARSSHTHNYAGSSSAGGVATSAHMIDGFSSNSTSIGWGNQTGTPIKVFNDSSGGSMGWRKDNPANGQMSQVIDGTVYIKEGNVNVGDAIKSITRSGTTFTYTTLWGNTGTFTQQDNNTNTWRPVVNGLTSDATDQSLSAAQGKALANGSARDNTKLPLSGGTLTGALNTANNTYNKIGDDAQLGDVNQAGKIGIKGINGATGFYFVPYSGSSAQVLSIDGAGTMTITGTLNVGTTIKQNGTAVSLNGHTHNYAGSSSAGGVANDSAKLGGATADTAASNNTIAKRTANGYLFATYLNQSSGAETPTTSSYIMYANSDGYLRKSTLANIKSILGLGSAAYTASTAYAAASHTHNYASSSHTHTNIVLAGANTEGTASTAFATNGMNVRWFSATGKVPQQPSQYGFMLTMATADAGSENHSIWAEQANGNLYHRGTNGSSYTSPPAFKKIYDSGNTTTTSIGSASGWSAGSAPSLSYTSRSIPNVTSVGTAPSLSYTARSIPNVTSVGSKTSVNVTVSSGVLSLPSTIISAVTVPTLGTAIAADDITAWSAGSVPTLGTAISADDITAWSAGSVPSLTITSVANVHKNA